MLYIHRGCQINFAIVGDPLQVLRIRPRSCRSVPLLMMMMMMSTARRQHHEHHLYTPHTTSYTHHNITLYRTTLHHTPGTSGTQTRPTPPPAHTLPWRARATPRAPPPTTTTRTRRSQRTPRTRWARQEAAALRVRIEC